MAGVTSLLPAAAVWVCAELDELLDYHRDQVQLRGRLPTDPIVRGAMVRIGLARQLGHRRARAGVAHPNVVEWSLAKGTKVDLERTGWTRIADDLPAAIGQTVYRAVSEAITNCEQHAYVTTAHDGPSRGNARSRRWWMIYRTSKNARSIAICDLGVGIRSSLERHATKRKWAHAFLQRLGLTRDPGDSDFITTAVEYGKSSTGLPHRGKGLPDVLRVCTEARRGFVRILSHKGSFTYAAARSDEPSTKDYDDTILGTVVEWTIPVPPDEAPP